MKKKPRQAVPDDLLPEYDLHSLQVVARGPQRQSSRDGMALSRALSSLQSFRGADLTRTLAKVEANLHGVTQNSCAPALIDCGAQAEILAAAALVKRISGQIDVVVHALGILLCLPHILEEGETIEYASLGAGNTGKPFDLETTHGGKVVQKSSGRTPSLRTFTT